MVAAGCLSHHERGTDRLMEGHMDETAGIRDRLTHLEGEVRALRGRVDHLSQAGALPPRPPFAPQPPAQQQWSPPPPQPWLPPAQAPAGAVTEAPAAIMWPASRASEASFFGTWYARLGAMAVLIGIAFGFKYAIDRGLVSAWMRVILGCVAGAGAIVWGDLVGRRHLRHLGQAGIAGGIGVLYASILAGLMLYELYPAPVGLLLLSSVAAGGGALALRHDSLPLAVMASMAAFGVALLLGLDEGAAGVVYAYVAIVDLGVLGLVVTRRWTILSPLAAAATSLLVSLRLDDASLGVALGFGTLFLLLFCGAALLRASRAGGLEAGERAVLVSGTFAYLALGLFVLERAGYEGALGAFTIALALTWGAIAVSARAGLLERTGAVPTAWGLCLALFVLAVPLQLEGSAVGIAWAAQGALLAWHAQRDHSRRVGGLAMVVCVLGFVTGLGQLVLILFEVARIVSLETVLIGLHISALLVSAHWFTGAGDDGRARAAGILAVLLGWGWLSVEVLVYSGDLGAVVQGLQFGWSIVWALYAAALLGVGVATRTRWPRMCATGLLAVVMVKLVVLDLWLLPALYRTLAFVGLGLVLMLCSLMYHRLLPTLLGGEESAEGSPHASR